MRAFLLLFPVLLGSSVSAKFVDDPALGDVGSIEMIDCRSCNQELIRIPFIRYAPQPNSSIQPDGVATMRLLVASTGRVTHATHITGYQWIAEKISRRLHGFEFTRSDRMIRRVEVAFESRRKWLVVRKHLTSTTQTRLAGVGIGS